MGRRLVIFCFNLFKYQNYYYGSCLSRILCKSGRLCEWGLKLCLGNDSDIIQNLLIWVPWFTLIPITTFNTV